jgi:hypothetical protein
MRSPRAIAAAMLLGGLISAACSGGPSGSAGSAASGSPEPSAPPAATPTASPSALPIASLGPRMSADALFTDDTPAGDLGLTERSSETRDGAVVRDIRYAGADGRHV